MRVQPEYQEKGEISGRRVRLALRQHQRRYSCLGIFFSSLLSLAITNTVWIPAILLIFLLDWQLTDGGLPPGSLETQPFSMCLILLLHPEPTVIGSLSSPLSYYVSPLGYPTYPWEHFTLRASPASPPPPPPSSGGRAGPAI